MSHRVRRDVLAAALCFAAATCTTTGSSRDPFAGGTSAAGRNRPAVRVGLEVVCDQCLVTFTAGAERGSARAAPSDQVWSYRFVRYPIGQESVELCAHDTAAEGRLSRIRIFVNGDTVASETNDPGDPRPMLCVSTLIPLPSDPPDNSTREGTGGPRR